jgi:hypothetical protein
MFQLRNFNPLTFDPAPARVAVQMHEAIVPRPGSTIFRFLITMPGEQEKRDYSFVMEPVAAVAEPGLRPFRQSGMAQHIFRFSAADVDRLRSMQQEARQARERNSAPGKLEIHVSSKACRMRHLPTGPLLTTTLIRTEAEGRFLVLLKDVDVRHEARKDGLDIEQAVPACS